MSKLGTFCAKIFSLPTRTRVAGICFLVIGFLLAPGEGSFIALAQATDRAAIEALVDSGKYAEAAEAAGEAIDDGDHDAALSVLKIRAELAAGAYADALKSFDAALAINSADLALRLVGREAYLYNNQPAEAGKQLATLQLLVQQTPWRYGDATNRVLVGRAALLAGADPRQVLDLFYDKARKERPDQVDAYLASGELALDKNDDALAAEMLSKSVKIAPSKPEPHYLLARALASSDDKRASAELAKALEINPRHVPSLLLQIDDRLDDEDAAGAEKLLDEIDAINPHEPLAWAYRAVIAHLAGDAKAEHAHRDKALEAWQSNPQVDHLIGRRLARNYRFAEAVKRQRSALAMAPLFTPAKIQLSQDLLRSGEEEEGWRLATEVFDRDGYNVVAHNLIALHEALEKFHSLDDAGFIIRMESREAEVYGDRVLALLREARATLCAKYKVELHEPVIVEIFPQQKDFAIRTFGLPGGEGFLGVCFGRVITANSPASQADHPTNWQAVLWHEFCHVVTLSKTQNKMPRWLSEGISVYEERQHDPTWGQAINPRYRARLLADDLTPVSRLSAAFLKPATPLDLQFAYFESSLVVQYIVEHYKLPALEKVLSDLAKDVPIQQALAKHTAPLDRLDADFAEYARAQAKTFGPKADWSELELPPDAGLPALAEWNSKHPQHYQGLDRQATRLLADKQWAAAKPVLVELKKIYPMTALPMLARAHRELKETVDERADLESLAGLDNDAIDAYSRLMDIGAAAADWPAVERNAERALAVNPLAAATYRQLAQAAESLGHVDGAIRARRALLLLDSSDPSENHYRLARLYFDKKELPAARRHVLQSLEETPRYRAAQMLLLQIVGPSKETSP